MKYLQNTRLILAILLLVVVIIIEIGKSIRINQLKSVDTTKIESIGEYEKKSKVEYLNVIEKNNTDE